MVMTTGRRWHLLSNARDMSRPFAPGSLLGIAAVALLSSSMGS